MKAPIRYTFPATEKLKSRKTIEQLFRTGKSFSHFPFRVIWIADVASAGSLKLGFAVSSKIFKKAVERNRIKRIMREACRLQKNELIKQIESQKAAVSVFIIYTGNEIPEYHMIHEKMGKLMDRLKSKLNENIKTDI